MFKLYLNLYQWEGEDVRKGCRRVNMVEILGTHVYVNQKMQLGGGGIKENDGRGKLNYDMSLELL
jgi:hypothetical protein